MRFRTAQSQSENGEQLPLSYVQKLNIHGDVELTHLAIRHGL